MDEKPLTKAKFTSFSYAVLTGLLVSGCTPDMLDCSIRITEWISFSSRYCLPYLKAVPSKTVIKAVPISVVPPGLGGYIIVVVIILLPT